MLLLAVVIHRPKIFMQICVIFTQADRTRKDAAESLDEETQSIALIPGRDLRTPKGHQTARLEGEVCIRGA